MKLTDSREIAAQSQDVWAALLNPEILKACVPGCTEMSGTAEEGFEATVVQKVGPVKATFKGAVTLSDMNEPHSLTLTGEGKGGAAGFAKGGADVKLEPSETGTLLTYDVEAKVGGKLAQLGSRIIDGFAKKMADQFFADFASAVEGDNPADEAPATTEAEEAGAEGDEDKKKGWLKRVFN